MHPGLGSPGAGVRTRHDTCCILFIRVPSWRHERGVTKVLLQFIFHIEEMEWAIEEALKTGLPLAATLAINEKGDHAGVPVGECAVRMAKAGAQVGEWTGGE